MEEKEILGYRDNFKIKNLKSTKITCLIIGILMLGLAVYLGISNGFLWSLIGIVLAVIIFLVIPLMNHLSKNLQKKNEWPKESIYYLNGKIYIDQSNLEIIDCRDIKKVTCFHYTEETTYGNIGSSVKVLPEGSITIKTKDNKKYYAENIKDIEDVVAKINSKIIVEKNE